MLLKILTRFSCKILLKDSSQGQLINERTFSCVRGTVATNNGDKRQSSATKQKIYFIISFIIFIHIACRKLGGRMFPLFEDFFYCLKFKIRCASSPIKEVEDICNFIFFGENSFICSFVPSPNLLWCSVLSDNLSVCCTKIFKIDKVFAAICHINLVLPKNYRFCINIFTLSLFV